MLPTMGGTSEVPTAALQQLQGLILDRGPRAGGLHELQSLLGRPYCKCTPGYMFRVIWPNDSNGSIGAVLKGWTLLIWPVMPILWISRLPHMGHFPKLGVLFWGVPH